MPVHHGSGSNQDERLPPPGPEHSQGNPEQFVQGSQSAATSLRVQSQQLLMESQILKDELLMGAESAEQPAEQMSERHDHVKNLTESSGIQLVPSHSFCRCTTFWRDPLLGSGFVKYFPSSRLLGDRERYLASSLDSCAIAESLAHTEREGYCPIKFLFCEESIGPPTDRKQLSTERIRGQQLLPA